MLLSLDRTQKNIICSLDAVRRALPRKKIFLAFEGHKGRKAKKGHKGQKNKYGSKCLELSNSARNAKKAKNCQKEPKAWRATNLAFKGPKLEI